MANNTFSMTEWLFDFLRNHPNATANPEITECKSNYAHGCVLGEINGHAIIGQADRFDRYSMTTGLDMTLSEFKTMYREFWKEYDKDPQQWMSEAAFAYSDVEECRSKRLYLWNHDHSKFEIREALAAGRL